MPDFDNARLKHKIKKSGYKRSYIADKCGISLTSLNNKLNGKTPFMLGEVQMITFILNLSVDEAISIFFTNGVPPEGTKEGGYENG